VKTEALTSPANPLLKDVRLAIARGGLTSKGCCVAEGFHLLEEALRSGADIQTVLASQSARGMVEARVRKLCASRVLVLPERLFETVAGTEASQGVITLVRPPRWTLEQVFQGRALVVVLDGVQDPGNAGTILRTAEAFSATGVLVLKGTVSPYNPKAVRASAGSLFRIPVVCGLEAATVLAAFEQQRLDLYAASPSGGCELPQANLRRNCALIIGNEGRGVRPELCAAATGLRIPTSRVESLNAAVAAAVLLYEARRQRTLR